MSTTDFYNVTKAQAKTKRRHTYRCNAFILAYIKYCTHKYFAMLGRNNYNVNLTNAQISHFISQNLEELRLEVLGEVVSLNIMSNLSTCMSWKKI